MHSVDFSGRSFHDIWLESSKVSSCKFIRCSFSDLRDRKNRFENCFFNKCNFKDASLGLLKSVYEHCTFKNCDFRGASFDNAVFKNVEFDNCKFEGVDFSASGFHNCRFIGSVTDVVFRGGYQLKMLYDKHTPSESGLFSVDFSKADMKWITTSNGCSVEKIVLPESGETLIISGVLVLSTFSDYAKSHFNEKELSSVLNTIHTYFGSEIQDWHFVSLSELVEDFGESLGKEVYEVMRQTCVVSELH